MSLHEPIKAMLLYYIFIYELKDELQNKTRPIQNQHLPTQNISIRKKWV